MQARDLFVVEKCVHCAFWKKRVHRFNVMVDIKDRIRVHDCTRYHDFKIIDDPIIRLYAPYIKNTYPVLFFKGRRYDGGNSLPEVESILKTELLINSKIPVDLTIEINGRRESLLFNKNCEFKKTLFGKKPVCS